MAKKSLQQLAADREMSVYEYLRWRYVRRSARFNGSDHKVAAEPKDDGKAYPFTARPGETEEQRFARVAGRYLIKDPEERLKRMNTLDL